MTEVFALIYFTLYMILGGVIIFFKIRRYWHQKRIRLDIRPEGEE